MITRLFDQLEQLPEVLVLLLNAGLGAFVLLAHGGALLLLLSGKVPATPEHEATIRTMAPVTLSIAGLVVLSSLVGLVASRTHKVVDRLQAVILFLSGTAMLAWAGNILIGGIPPGNFSWGVGLLTGWVSYSGLLCSRTVLEKQWKQGLRYMTVTAAIVALVVDFGVLVRFMAGVDRL
jgi:lysylphosphatidylglycerol synthetase-like protein (DUF2156 family)